MGVLDNLPVVADGYKGCCNHPYSVHHGPATSIEDTSLTEDLWCGSCLDAGSTHPCGTPQIPPMQLMPEDLRQVVEEVEEQRRLLLPQPQDDGWLANVSVRSLVLCAKPR